MREYGPYKCIPKKQPKEKRTENPTKTKTVNEMKTEYIFVYGREAKYMKEWTETNRNEMKKLQIHPKTENKMQLHWTNWISPTHNSRMWER